MRQGFSLVELSIVLVILGLLTGGILAGQSLIRAAELRSVATEYNRFVTATHGFRDKYMAIPGDMSNATRFWGRAASTSDCPTNSSAIVTSSGTCDGDGGGDIVQAPAANQYGERFLFWQQLALAGLIEGSYSGKAGSAGALEHVAGSNAPAGKLSNTAWAVFDASTQANYIGNASVFDGNYRQQFVQGAVTSGTTPNGSYLQPAEMWNIDTKVDDGKPAIGKMVVRVRTACAIAADGSALTSSAADAAKLDARYDLSNTSKDCAPLFRQAF